MKITIANKSKKNLGDQIDKTITVLSDIRNYIEKSDIAKSICSEYGQEHNILSGVPIAFGANFEAPAKTVNGHIILNESLINKDMATILRYVMHELVHVMQHMQLESSSDPYHNKEYLDRPDEVEAFQFQIEFDAKINTKEKAIQYAQDLVEYHELPDGKRDRKVNELIEKIDE